jgi:hypothetical protein
MHDLWTPMTAAKIYAFFTLMAVGFQIALAFGAPWGRLAMGGKYPGVYPKTMRIAAVLMGAFLALLAAIVGVRAGWLYPELIGLTSSLIWFVVVVNTLGFLMNLITPSRWERMLWAPVTCILLLCSVWVGMS